MFLGLSIEENINNINVCNLFQISMGNSSSSSSGTDLALVQGAGLVAKVNPVAGAVVGGIIVSNYRLYKTYKKIILLRFATKSSMALGTGSTTANRRGVTT